MGKALTHNIRFEAEVGTRILRSHFWGICASDADGHALWWSDKLKRWLTWEESRELRSGYSTHYHGPRTYKAFLSHLRDHPELAGATVTLVSRFHDHSIVAEPTIH